ncbi:hypothetical protein BN1723_014132 [Verticillium longisporum]|uniref:Protein kish n=1 Tax=Verticillium longisporum TaxID=100787 RepID=A0A0G4M2S0_VERLO|nr:hypothetical protein BN1723_014132 [Verticillium longisporum]
MSNPTPARNNPAGPPCHLDTAGSQAARQLSRQLHLRHRIAKGTQLAAPQDRQDGKPSLHTKAPATNAQKSALFNFQSLLLVILLLICTSAYTHQIFPSFMDNRKDGLSVVGIFWKFARVGERLSPYVSLACVFMAVSLLIN